MLAADDIDILVVEDNPGDLFLLKKMLDASTLRINKLYTADRIEEARKVLQSQHFHIALLDLSLPDSYGIDTYLDIKSSVKKIPVIILTGLNDAETALEALNQGAQDYLVKGEFNGDLLSRSISYSLKRKNAEEALQVSEEKYRQMFYQNFFPAWIYDPASLRLLEVNDAAIKKYGYSREEFLTLTLKDIRPPEDVSRLLRTLGKDAGEPKVWRHRKKNGEIMIVEVVFYPINYFGKVASQAQIHDVTEQVKLQEKLKEQQKTEQKNITAAVLRAMETVKGRLGEELHDNINQILAASKMYLEYVTDAGANEDLIVKSLNGISLAMEEIRKLSRTLIVSDIKEIGLKRSIEQMIQNIVLVKKIVIELNMEDFPEQKLDEEVKIAIYRIIQEQLTNILKHADAELVRITLSKKEKKIIMEIQDNGKGFDPSLFRKGVGITNINSRASVYDGKVELNSTPGKGCHLKVTLPIKI